MVAHAETYNFFVMSLYDVKEATKFVTLRCIITYGSAAGTVTALYNRVWQRCWLRYLFFTNHRLARSTTCGSVSLLQIGGQYKPFVTHHPPKCRDSATRLEKGEVDLK